VEVTLFGGAFDPIHYGHTYIIKILLKKYPLIWILVSLDRKDKLNISNIDNRLQKIKLAIADIQSNRIKIIIDKFNSSYELLNYLSKRYRNFRFNFVIGYDNLIFLHKWHKWQYFLKLCHKLIVFVRDWYIYNYCKVKNHYLSYKIIIVFAKRNRISSTYIRQKSLTNIK